MLNLLKKTNFEKIDESLIKLTGLPSSEVSKLPKDELAILNNIETITVENIEEIANTLYPNLYIDGEKVLCRVKACGGQWKTRRKSIKNNREGISIKLTKGVSYRVGHSNANREDETVFMSSQPGLFIITEKRFLLLTEKDGFILNFEDIIESNLNLGVLELYNKDGKCFLVKFNNYVEPITMINLLNKVSL